MEFSHQQKRKTRKVVPYQMEVCLIGVHLRVELKQCLVKTLFCNHLEEAMRITLLSVAKITVPFLYPNICPTKMQHGKIPPGEQWMDIVPAHQSRMIKMKRGWGQMFYMVYIKSVIGMHT